MSKLNKEQTIEIINGYKSGHSAGYISKQYKITSTTVYALLKRNNISRRTYSESSRKYTLNEYYFENIDNQDRAYFLGFLMADGYNNEKRKVIELSCAEKDREILEKLNVLIMSSKPIRFVSSKGVKSYRIDWCSGRLSSDLAKYGCVQSKSLILTFPKIEDSLIRHFIRGYFDGDGCISYSLTPRNNYFGNSLNSVCTFTSTESFCLYLKEYFKINFDINSTMLCRNPSHNNSNRTLQISGNSQVKRIMEWMYVDATIFLERKRYKFEEIRDKIALRKKELRILRGGIYKPIITTKLIII